MRIETPTLDALNARACRWLAGHYDETHDSDEWPGWVAVEATVPDDDVLIPFAFRELADLADLPRPVRKPGEEPSEDETAGSIARISINRAFEGVDESPGATEDTPLSPAERVALRPAVAAAVRLYLVNASTENGLMRTLSDLAHASLLATDEDDEYADEWRELYGDSTENG